MCLRDFFSAHIVLRSVASVRVYVCVCVQASKHIAHRNTHPSLSSVSVCHNANPLYATQHYSPHPKWHTPLSLLPLSSSVERWQFATTYTSLLKMLWHVSSWILIHIFMLHLNFFVTSRLALNRWDFTSLFACSCCLMWKLVWWFIYFYFQLVPFEPSPDPNNPASSSY